jgi:S-adenosylmethionine decarboxylase
MGDDTFGMHLLLDIRDCTEPINADSLIGWVVQLCAVIGMRRFGDPFVAYFGEATPKTAGWSLLQPIETSSIGAHEMPMTRGLSVDVYSCRLFDPNEAVAVCLRWFGGRVAYRTLLMRG